MSAVAAPAPAPDRELPPDTPLTTGRFLRLLVAVVVVLLLAEVGARLLGQRGEADPWNGTVAAGHIDAIEARAAEGGVDALLLGSSMAGADFDPVRLAEQLPGSDAAYNLWVTGPNMATLRLLATELALPLLHPDVLVLEVNSRVLNDRGQPQQRHHKTMRRSFAGIEAFGAPNLLARADYEAGQVSDLIRLRPQLRDPSWVRDALAGGGASGSGELTPEGMSTVRLDRDFSTDPRHEAQELEALQGFEVGGDQLDELRALIQEVRAGGVEVVLVDMPIVEDAYARLHPGGQEDLSDYRAELADLAAEVDVPVLWMGDETWGREHFADLNHLNGVGARRLSDLVAAALPDALTS